MTDRDRRTEITPELQTYMIEHGARQDELPQRVERETHELGGAAVMQVAPDQGALSTLLARSSRGRARARGRHLHRLQRDLHRPRAGETRPPAVLEIEPG